MRIGRVSAINDDKVSVLFKSLDNSVSEELPVLKPYVNADNAIIQIDDIVVVEYTTDGTGIVIGHL